MAEIKVGSTITYRGQSCICTRFERRVVEEFTQVGSLLFLEKQRSQPHDIYLNMEVGTFDDGDLICIEQEFVVLTSPMAQQFNIFTKYKAYKKGADDDGDDTSGDEEVPDASPSDEAEATH